LLRFFFIFLSSLVFVHTKIDAQNFFSVGNGIGGCDVRTLFADTASNILYVGGDYISVRGLNTQGIASWNGTQWDSLGSGLDYNGICARYVAGIVRYQNEIWVCGGIDSIGGKKLWWGARWNGTQWDSIPGGTQYFNYNGMIWNFYVSNNELYAMGAFDSIGGIASDKIAKWNGSAWTSFPPLDTTSGGWAITCASMYNGELYVGGNFDSQIASNMKDIAKWNGTNWQSVGGGLSGANTVVDDLTVFNGELYVSGYFQTSFGDPGNNIAKWNGTSWSQVGTGCGGANVFAMKEYRNELYVGGAINDAGGTPVTYIAKWDGSQWYDLGSILDNTVTSFAVMNNALYVGGGFWSIDGDTLMSGVAKYEPPVAIETLSSEYGFSIFPNPNQGIFTLLLKTMDAELSFLNLLGEIIHFKIINSENTEIDLSKEAKGIYFVRIVCGDWIHTEKIIIH